MQAIIVGPAFYAVEKHSGVQIIHWSKFNRFFLSVHQHVTKVTALTAKHCQDLILIYTNLHWKLSSCLALKPKLATNCYLMRLTNNNYTRIGSHVEIVTAKPHKTTRHTFKGQSTYLITAPFQLFGRKVKFFNFSFNVDLYSSERMTKVCNREL